MNHEHFLPPNYFAYLTVVTTLCAAWRIGMAEQFKEPTNEAVGFVMESLTTLRDCMGDAAQMLDCEATEETYEAIDDAISELMARHVRVHGPDDPPPDPALAALLATPTHIAH